MRIVVLVVGLLLAMVVSTAGAFWWLTQPARFAGIDRDPARAASRAALTEAEQPGITRGEIVGLLREREFETLTRIIETRNERALADPQEEWELGRVVDAFGTADDSLADEFDEWIQASPGSFAPLLASAKYRFAMSGAARGEKLASETTERQFAGMQRQLALLFEHSAQALRHEPRLSEAYVVMINAARLGGTQIDCGNFAMLGLEVMPASFRVRNALAICRLPRWGGSYPRVEGIAKAADPFFADNPALAALHGIVEWDKGRLANGKTAIAHFDEALRAGAHAQFYFDRAREHYSAKRYEAALDDLNAALELRPDDPDVLVFRMYTFIKLGQRDELGDLIALIDNIDPTHVDLPQLKEYATKLAAQETRTPSEAEARTYLARGREHLEAGRHDAALSNLKTAIRLDPSLFNAYLHIDYLHAERGEWHAIITMWDEYLEKYPEDGRAVWERAGAIRHSGDETRALKEARRACDMGIKDACTRVRR